jgi:hypothetical protein
MANEQLRNTIVELDEQSVNQLEEEDLPCGQTEHFENVNSEAQIEVGVLEVNDICAGIVRGAGRTTLLVAEVQKLNQRKNMTHYVTLSPELF